MTAVVAFIVVPKNRGLQKYRQLALSSLQNVDKRNVVEVRGEDVAFWVNEFLKQGKKVLGLTGEDLFKEYCMETRDGKLAILRRIFWNDSEAVFGKPALCLLGPESETLDTLPKNLRVCVASKYKRIARKYLNLLERNGFAFKKVYVNGSSEAAFSQGIATLLIDIVYTGSSMRKTGLRVYDKIMLSDFVVIGGKND